MPSEENMNSDIQNIFDNLGNLVGEGEIEARRVLGDERYERTVMLMDQGNLLALQKDAVQIKYIEMLTILQRSASLFLIFSCMLGLAWSCFYWFS